MSFAVTAKLICVFVFAYAKSRFSYYPAHSHLETKGTWYYTIRDWNDLPDSLISSAELSDECVSKFITQVELMSQFPAPGVILVFHQ